MSDAEPIIYVDDDEDDHFLIQKALENLRFPHPLKSFFLGQHLIDYLTETPDKPFIIICDINMPRMNGIEVRSAIHQDEYLRNKSIPFIFYSTAVSMDQLREAYKLTIQGFFIKEQKFDALQQTLKEILEYWKKCKHPNNSPLLL